MTARHRLVGTVAALAVAAAVTAVTAASALPGTAVTNPDASAIAAPAMGGSVAGVGNPGDPSAGDPSTAAAANPTAGPAVPAALPSLDPDEVALQSAMPGIYGADDLHPAVSGSGISVWSQHSCLDLLGVLRAGQWSIDVVHQPAKKGQRTWVATMAKGGDRALLTLNGGPGGCSGHLEHDQVARATASGAIETRGDGRFLSVICQPQWDDTSSSTGSNTTSAPPIPSEEFLIGLYTAGGRGILVEAELPTKPGTYHVSATQLAQADSGDNGGGTPSVGITLLPTTGDPLALTIKAFGPLLYPLDLTGAQDDQSSMAELLAAYPTFGGGPKSAETIRITQSSPLTGTFTATALTDQSHPDRPTLDISAPFTCDA